ALLYRYIVYSSCTHTAGSVYLRSLRETESRFELLCNFENHHIDYSCSTGHAGFVRGGTQKQHTHLPPKSTAEGEAHKHTHTRPHASLCKYHTTGSTHGRDNATVTRARLSMFVAV
ncbi:unnamed protein product, partial [Ectocarpus fasciculatus]